MNTPAPTQIDPSVYDKWRGSVLGRKTDARERELLLDLIGDVCGQVILDGNAAGKRVSPLAELPPITMAWTPPPLYGIEVPDWEMK